MSYTFGPFRCDAEQRLLFHGAEVVPLVSKVVETLHVLLELRSPWATALCAVTRRRTFQAPSNLLSTEPESAPALPALRAKWSEGILSYD